MDLKLKKNHYKVWTDGDSLSFVKVGKDKKTVLSMEDNDKKMLKKNYKYIVYRRPVFKKIKNALFVTLLITTVTTVSYGSYALNYNNRSISDVKGLKEVVQNSKYIDSKLKINVNEFIDDVVLAFPNVGVLKNGVGTLDGRVIENKDFIDTVGAYYLVFFNIIRVRPNYSWNDICHELLHSCSSSFTRTVWHNNLPRNYGAAFDEGMVGNVANEMTEFSGAYSENRCFVRCLALSLGNDKLLSTFFEGGNIYDVVSMIAEVYGDYDRAYDLILKMDIFNRNNVFNEAYTQEEYTSDLADIFLELIDLYFASITMADYNTIYDMEALKANIENLLVKDYNDKEITSKVLAFLNKKCAGIINGLDDKVKIQDFINSLSRDELLGRTYFVSKEYARRKER